MTIEDRRRMAAELKLPTAVFTRRYCRRQNGIWRLKDGPGGDCLFLKRNKCSVYAGRPTQCRTWPFWPETLEAKVWNNEVAGFCPGGGKGRLHRPEEIERVLREQIKSEEGYGS